MSSCTWYGLRAAKTYVRPPTEATSLACSPVDTESVPRSSDFRRTVGQLYLDFPARNATSDHALPVGMSAEARLINGVHLRMGSGQGGREPHTSYWTIVWKLGRVLPRNQRACDRTAPRTRAIIKD